MPKMVQELARYDGKTISYKSHTNGGWTLQQHAASAVIFIELQLFISNKQISLIIMFLEHKIYYQYFIVENKQFD